MAQSIPPQAPLPAAPSLSPFFASGPLSTHDSLAILHLKRDQLLPVTLRSTADDGYAEGAVTNTRFGSFPHSTLLDVPWGSQVRASIVDTGSRGRRGKNAKAVEGATDGGELQASEGAGDDVEAVQDNKHKKRRSDDELSQQASIPKRQKKDKAGDAQNNGRQEQAAKQAVQAGSGFIHLFPPTPEAWTMSLDHRTQVVYTPDYSYILQRMHVRPGQSIIEAGAGSGSFTHAAARAIFNGCPDTLHPQKRRTGRVCSFEFHQPRVETLKREIHEHDLDGVVQLTYRDVCNDGFALSDTSDSSPKANAIFLDLPAPHLALKHLTRAAPSALDPETTTQLCTFSPCIEQVTATVSTLRKQGWTEIEMVEVQHKRIDVRRERVGLREEGLRGVNASAANVDEAVQRLREVEKKLSSFHGEKEERRKAMASGVRAQQTDGVVSKQERLERIKREAETRKVYKEGNLVHRSEPELKTHTSYLVFAVLPRAWTEEDEKMCVAKWPLPPPKEVAPSANGAPAAGKTEDPMVLGDGAKDLPEPAVT